MVVFKVKKNKVVCVKRIFRYCIFLQKENLSITYRIILKAVLYFI